jgi:hypothetical protein
LGRLLVDWFAMHQEPIGKWGPTVVIRVADQMLKQKIFEFAVWTDFGRKVNVGGRNTGPKRPGPSARAVCDQFSSVGNRFTPNRPKTGPET